MRIRFTRKVFDTKFEDSIFTVVWGLLMGILTILFIIWNRVIRERLPREIIGEAYMIDFWIVFVLFIYIFFIVSFKIYSWQKQWRGIHSRNRYILKIIEYVEKIPNLTACRQFVRNYITNATVYLWRFIYFNTPGKYGSTMKNFLHKSGSMVCYYCFDEEKGETKKQVIAMILFVYFPKILVFSIFFFEIVINRKLHYFYSFAILLALPIIFLALRRIYLDFCYYAGIFLQETVIKVVPHPEIPGEFIIKRINNSISEPRYSEAFVDIKTIEKVLVDLFQIGDKYDSKVNLLIHILLLLSFMFWLLILLKII